MAWAASCTLSRSVLTRTTAVTKALASLLLDPERYRTRKHVVGFVLLVLDRARLDADLRSLVELARLEAFDLHGRLIAGLYALDGRRERLALGPGVENDLHRYAGLGDLSGVLHGDGEGQLVGAGEYHVPSLNQRSAGHRNAGDLHVARRARVVGGGGVIGRLVGEAQGFVVHKRISLVQV